MFYISGNIMPLFKAKNNLPIQQVLSPKVAESATFQALFFSRGLKGFCIGLVQGKHHKDSISVFFNFLSISY